MLAQVICLPSEDIRRAAMFLPSGYALRHQQHKRSGRPRFQCTQEAMEDYRRAIGITYRTL
eukprot:5190650-Prorocentrum_lima.AAC.1